MLFDHLSSVHHTIGPVEPMVFIPSNSSSLSPSLSLSSYLSYFISLSFSLSLTLNALYVFSPFFPSFHCSLNSSPLTKNFVESISCVNLACRHLFFQIGKNKCILYVSLSFNSYIRLQKLFVH